ncbi:MAG: hypothetical protein FJ145_14335 [Deltaproteobacteria bacterium]|nr:hypothetical protein [Deltaproteobacteria bacterium]
MANLKLFGSDTIDQTYARALRAIGRDLASLFPENLEIEVIGATYKVQYHLRAKTLAPEKPEKASLLRNLFKKSETSAPAPATTSFQPETRTYAQDALDRINSAQSAARHADDGNPDIYDLSERLRTVGRVVDKIQGTLIKVSKGANSVQFHYADAKGLEHNDELSNQELYRMQREFFASREHHSGNDIWGEQAR